MHTVHTDTPTSTGRLSMKMVWNQLKVMSEKSILQVEEEEDKEEEEEEEEEEEKRRMRRRIHVQYEVMVQSMDYLTRRCPGEHSVVASSQ